MSEVSFHIASECNLHVCDFQWLLALNSKRTERNEERNIFARYEATKLRTFCEQAEAPSQALRLNCTSCSTTSEVVRWWSHRDDSYDSMTMSAMKLEGLPGPQLYCECLQCHQQDGRASVMYIYIYIFFFLIFIHMHRVYTNINDLNIIYVYICILHKCSAMLQIVDVFKCFWLTLMESYGKYVESMWKSLFLCPWRSNALHTRTPAAPLSVFGGHTFRLDPTFKSVRCIRCISWGGYEWTAQLDATHLEPGMGH